MLHSLRFPLKWSAAATPRIEVWKPSDAHNPAEGERHLVSGDYPEAERCLTEALADADRYGHDRSMQVRLTLLLAQAQREQSKLDAAEETARAALAIAVQSKDLSLYTQCLDGLADVYKVQENFPALEAVAGEALHIEQSLARPDPKRLAGRMRHLGLAQNRTGRPGDGLASLENALTLHEKAYGPEHEETARLLHEMGGIYGAQKQHVAAQKHLLRALHLRENQRGPESPEAVAVLHQLAGSLEECGNIDEAAALYERALQLKERVLGGDLEGLADDQMILAGMYGDWGNPCRARELLREAIHIFKRKKGRRLAVAYEALAHVEEHSGRAADAVSELALAAKIWESMGAEHVPDVIANLDHRVELLELIHNLPQAAWLREQPAS